MIGRPLQVEEIANAKALGLILAFFKNKEKAEEQHLEGEQ